MRGQQDWDPSGIGAVMLYGVGWAFALVGVNLFAIALTVLALWMEGGVDALGSFADAAHRGLSPTLPGWVIVSTLLVQFLAMGTLILVTDRVGRWLFRRQEGAPWRERLAWVSPPRWAWIPTVVVGMTAGWLPGWMADALRERLPWLDLGALASLHTAITDGPLLTRIGMWMGVVILAPVFEELLFRGWMWNQLERSLPSWGVWIATSVLFAVYHIDPLQGTALLFTAFALGWVRWHTGSLLPCVVIHGINNALGVTAAHLDDAADLPLNLALAGALLTLTACAHLYWTARPAPPRSAPGQA